MRKQDLSGLQHANVLRDQSHDNAASPLQTEHDTVLPTPASQASVLGDVLARVGMPSMHPRLQVSSASCVLAGLPRPRCEGLAWPGGGSTALSLRGRPRFLGWPAWKFLRAQESRRR